MVDRLKGKRVLITQADDYMGPDFIPIFEEEGAIVIADTRDLTVPSAAKDLIAETGHIDVLIAIIYHNIKYSVYIASTRYLNQLLLKNQIKLADYF